MEACNRGELAGMLQTVHSSTQGAEARLGYEGLLGPGHMAGEHTRLKGLHMDTAAARGVAPPSSPKYLTRMLAVQHQSILSHTPSHR